MKQDGTHEPECKHCCGQLRTVADAETTSREQGSTPKPPELNENPSLCIPEKHWWPSCLAVLCNHVDRQRFEYIFAAFLDVSEQLLRFVTSNMICFVISLDLLTIFKNTL